MGMRRFDEVITRMMGSFDDDGSSRLRTRSARHATLAGFCCCWKPRKSGHETKTKERRGSISLSAAAAGSRSSGCRLGSFIPWRPRPAGECVVWSSFIVLIYLEKKESSYRVSSFLGGSRFGTHFFSFKKRVNRDHCDWLIQRANDVIWV